MARFRHRSARSSSGFPSPARSVARSAGSIVSPITGCGHPPRHAGRRQHHFGLRRRHGDFLWHHRRPGHLDLQSAAQQSGLGHGRAAGFTTPLTGASQGIVTLTGDRLNSITAPWSISAAAATFRPRNDSGTGGSRDVLSQTNTSFVNSVSGRKCRSIPMLGRFMDRPRL